MVTTSSFIHISVACVGLKIDENECIGKVRYYLSNFCIYKDRNFYWKIHNTQSNTPRWVPDYRKKK